ncbi:hypothetical protein L0F63_004235, partial [Massospora cicadina]
YNGESTPHAHQPHLPPVNYLPIQPGPPPPQDRQPLPPIHQNYNSLHVNTIQPHPQERHLRPSIHQPILSQLNQANQRVPPEASEILSQGQSPVGSPRSPSSGVRPLNVRDALSYLDRVKLEFQNQPEIYNRFLDIMKDFKSQAIDTPGVIDRVSTLFRGYPSLVFGFNTFLPPGFRIEMSSDPNDPNGVRVIVPDPPAPVPLSQVEMDHYGNHLSGHVSSHPTYQLPPPFEHLSSRASQASHYYPPISSYPKSDADPHGMPPSLHHPNPSLTHRKPPVEFNHAINYVNRIKNRFSRDPDSYKQFLEILQLYQKEQKPIKEIYAQVQVLFGNDTDLLEEFCQFLPDPAISSTDPSNHLSRPSSSHYNNLSAHPSHGINLPPLGSSSSRSYPPPPLGPTPHHAGYASSKHGKFPPHARSVCDADTVGRSPQGRGPLLGPVLVSPSLMGGTKKKRGMLGNDRMTAQAKSRKARPGGIKPKDEMEVNQAEQEAYEAQFASHAALIAPPETVEKFDSIKQYINHLPTYHEFLKVLNLHTQGIIDVDSLVSSVEAFIGGHAGLFAWFKEFVAHTHRSEPVPSILTVPKPKVDLTKCRRFGPSYRLLPKSETQIVCSGRDELCHEVLNDMFASHPTWVSEESVFVAHKKNTYEENLHKSEEDRFELDFNLETNKHTIALLEPIAKQIAKMTPEEQAAFRLPPGLGGRSTTIYRRAIYKLYDTGADEVFELLHSSPAKAIPVVLRRLKQKDLEWHEHKKEWNKVWREIDFKNYYRSLDNQTAQFKCNDRKCLTPRYLATEIEAIKREREQGIAGDAIKFGHPHLTFALPDNFIHKDIGRLLLCLLNNNPAFSPAERAKIVNFVRSFVFDFFGVPIMEDADDSKFKDKEPDLPQKRRRVASLASEPSEEGLAKLPAEPAARWQQLPLDPNAGLAISFRHPAQVLMFCNQHVYSILRLYQILYLRLSSIKGKSSQADIRFRNLATRRGAANELDLMPKLEALAGIDANTVDCYLEFLNFTERVIEGDLDQSAYEDAMRFVFGNHVYTVFTLDKILNGLCKQINHVFLEQNRTSLELVRQFGSLRRSSGGVLTVASLASYRQTILPLLADEESLYMVEYSNLQRTLAFQLFEANELSHQYLLGLEKVWSSYCSCFSAEAPTTGVVPQRPSFLKRCRDPSQDESSDIVFSPGLQPGICPTSFRLRWPPAIQQESFLRRRPQLAMDLFRAKRKERWARLLDGRTGWSRHLAHPSKAESHYRCWLEGKAKRLLVRVDREFEGIEPSEMA